jgi:hypothetical protein
MQSHVEVRAGGAFKRQALQLLPTPNQLALSIEFGGPSLRDPCSTRLVNLRGSHALIGRCEELQTCLHLIWICHGDGLCSSGAGGKSSVGEFEKSTGEVL